MDPIVVMHIKEKTMKRKIWGTLTLLVMSVIAMGQRIEIEQPLKMLALGDSYTIGESVPPVESWPEQFIDELRDLGVEAEEPDIIAETGWTTQFLISAIENRDPQPGDYNLVSLLIGVNNQYRGQDIELYEPQFRQLLETALSLAGGNANHVFVLSIPDYSYTPSHSSAEGVSEAIDAYNAINRRVSEEMGVPYVDITFISRQGLERPGLVASDDLHPSVRQYKEWVGEILRFADIPGTTAILPGQPDESRIQWRQQGDNLVIRSRSDTDKLYRVYDLSGREKYRNTASAGKLTIPVSTWEPGVYMLDETSHEGKRVARIKIH